MVIYDQLRISDDGRLLFIDAHVNTADYFDNMYIKRITICTENQVSETNPESYGEDYAHQEEYESPSDKKELHLVLSAASFNGNFSGTLSSHLFFVYIECEGTPDTCTPCRLDEMTTLGVTFDYGVIFNQAMNYTKELADTCEVSKNFIDFILNYEALKLSIETEHYIPAINFWKQLTGVGSVGKQYTSPKGCGCHG